MTDGPKARGEKDKESNGGDPETPIRPEPVRWRWRRNRGEWDFVRGDGYDILGRDGCDEAVALFGEGLYKSRGGGRIVEGLADSAKTIMETLLVLDERPFLPHGFAQLFPGDDLTSALEEFC
jgi:hypothetical protein